MLTELQNDILAYHQVDFDAFGMWNVRVYISAKLIGSI